MTLGVSGPAGLDSEMRGYLRPGEELIWQGGPAQSFTLAPADGFAIPFTIAWFSFACFWTVGASRADGPVAGLLGLPFVAIGAYAVAGRFLVKRYQHRHTAYGVTQDRAMIVTPRVFRDLPLRGVPVNVQRSRDGRRVSVIMSTPEPDLSYGFLGRRRPSQAAAARYANSGLEPLMRSAPFPFAFYDVEDPDGLLAALERARTATPS
jgi:hypothetical protein